MRIKSHFSQMLMGKASRKWESFSKQADIQYNAPLMMVCPLPAVITDTETCKSDLKLMNSSPHHDNDTAR